MMRTLPQLLRHPALAPSLSLDEWSVLLPQLKYGALLGRFGELLRLHGINQQLLPAAVQRQLDAAASAAWVQARSCRWESGEIARAMRGSRIPLMVVKGASYLLTDAMPGRGRFLDDVDILVTRQALPEVERRLVTAGWECQPPETETSNYYREWLHQVPPFVHTVRGTMVDVHHTIIAPWGGYRVDVDALFAKAVPTQVEGLLAPSPIDRCLVVAAHFVRSDAPSGAFRDLLDLSQLMAEAAPTQTDFQELVERARAVGLWRALSVATHFAAVFFGTSTTGPRPIGVAQRARALIPEGVTPPGMFTTLLRRGQQVAAFRAALPLRVMAKRAIQRRLKRD